MQEFVVRSHKKVEAINVTREVEQAIACEKIRDGIVFVFVPHCTSALVVNEFEPKIASDYEKLFAMLEGRDWKHNQIDDNAAAHLASAVCGTQKFFFVRGGKLVLGTWQRIILMELDGPRERRVLLEFIKLR